VFDRTILFTGANGTYCGSLTAAEVVTVCERYCGACASRETAATRASQVSVARPVDKTYSKLRSAVDDTITIMSSIYTNIRTVKCPTIVIQNDNNNSEVCSAVWVGGNDAVRAARSLTGREARIRRCSNGEVAVARLSLLLCCCAAGR